MGEKGDRPEEEKAKPSEAEPRRDFYRSRQSPLLYLHYPGAPTTRRRVPCRQACRQGSVCQSGRSAYCYYNTETQDLTRRLAIPIIFLLALDFFHLSLSLFITRQHSHILFVYYHASESASGIVGPLRWVFLLFSTRYARSPPGRCLPGTGSSGSCCSGRG